MYFYNHMFLGLAQPCYLFVHFDSPSAQEIIIPLSKLTWWEVGNHFLRDKMNTKIITAKSSKAMHVEECVGLVNH